MTPSQIPDDWSPEEALAVYAFIDDLLEHLWTRYGLRIQERCAQEHITRHDRAQPDLFAPDDPIPFRPDPNGCPRRMTMPACAHPPPTAGESAILTRVWTAANRRRDGGALRRAGRLHRRGPGR
jgi:hypothetical protein